MRYAGVMENDTVDCIQGICVSFWCQGCLHKCQGCHNPQTWDKDGGYELPDNYIDKILDLIDKNGIRRDFSVLGGEPLCDDNKYMVRDLCAAVRSHYPDITIYIWSGGLYEDLIQDPVIKEILSYCTYLIDGPFVLSKRDITRPLRGSTNQRVIYLKSNPPDIISE